MMISALWSNSNYDDDKGTRRNAIEDIESNFDEAIKALRGQVEILEEVDDDDDNPFMTAAKRGVEELERRVVKKPQNEDGTVQEEVDQMKYIDQ